MKKITSLLLVLSMLSAVFALTGCHGLKGPGALSSDSLPESFDESRQHEIVFWAKNENNKAQQDIYHKAAEDFSKIYPNITVKVKLYSDYGKIYEDVITNIQTGTTPNVCITYPDHIATYMTGDNIVLPLDDFINHDSYGLGADGVKFDAPTKDEMIGGFLSEGVIEGSQYALPFMRSTEACYINRDLVEKLGYEIPEVLTWDFIFEVSDAAMALGKETVTDKNGKEVEVYKLNGQSTLIPFIYKSTDNMMIQMLAQKDADYSTENGEVKIFNDTTKELLLEISEHAKLRSFSTFKISSYPGNFLNAGQCLFAIDSTAGSTWIGADAPLIDISKENLKQFETVVKPIPQFNTDNPEMISQGPSLCIFNKADVNEVVASWLFAQYLLTNEVQIPYSQTEGYVPVTAKAQNSAEYLDYLARGGENNTTYYKVKIDATKLLLNNLDKTFVTSVFNGSASLRDASGHLIEEVCKAARRGKTVDDAFIANLYKETTALYKLDQIKVKRSEGG